MSVRWRSRAGSSLVEVLVALTLLQVGLLGAAGMVATAARAVSEAARTDRALALGEAVADSLEAFGWGGGGERAVEGLIVRWSRTGAWAVVEVWGPDADAGEVGDAGPLVRLPVALGDP